MTKPAVPSPDGYPPVASNDPALTLAVRLRGARNRLRKIYRQPGKLLIALIYCAVITAIAVSLKLSPLGVLKKHGPKQIDLSVHR